MNIFSFTAEFGSEEACRNHFKSERDKLGVCCKKCGHKEHYWIKSQWSYQCKKCSSRTSLRSGTIMQSSNLSFMIWYKTMFLLTATKKGFSSKEIQRQLGLKRYEPVWAMVHKLRKAMGNRDDRYTLEGMIEMDEGYFTVESSEFEKSKGLRGRGAAGQGAEDLREDPQPPHDRVPWQRRPAPHGDTVSSVPCASSDKP